MNTSDWQEREAADAGATIKRAGTWRCWHRWAVDEVHTPWRYRGCEKCGRRTIRRVVFGIMGPVNWRWLETGEWTPPPSTNDLVSGGLVRPTGGPAA